LGLGLKIDNDIPLVILTLILKRSEEEGGESKSMTSKVAIVKCASYDPLLVQKNVREAVELLGGISNFIKPGSRVLVKPNLLMAKEPEFGIDTHPEVVRAVIKVLKGINCIIFVGDGPSVWGNQAENVEDVYEVSGIKKVCQEEGIDLVKFENRRMREKFPLTTWLDNCDYIVNVPKFKTHSLTTLTAAVKNLFGCVVGNFKMELHKNYFDINDFCGILLDIYKEIKPALTIVDGIIAMEGEGPATSGKLRQSNLIIAGSDCISIDSVLAFIMGLKAEDILTNKIGQKRGLGVADLKQIEIIGEKLENVKGAPFLLPSASIQGKLPAPVAKFILKFVKHHPCVDKGKCIKCFGCAQACPKDAVELTSKGIVFDYTKCISCFCCLEYCPAGAIKVKKSFLARLLHM